MEQSVPTKSHGLCMNNIAISEL